MDDNQWQKNCIVSKLMSDMVHVFKKNNEVSVNYTNHSLQRWMDKSQAIKKKSQTLNTQKSIQDLNIALVDMGPGLPALLTRGH